MALHLNLYHEVLKQQMQRRRDPLKLGLYGMVLIAAILLAYYFYRVQQVYRISAQAGQLQTQWKISEPEAAKAKARQAELEVSIKTKQNLVQWIEGRFYWAPLLELLQQTVPRDVQLTAFMGAVDMDAKSCNLALTGIAGSVKKPREVAEDLRTALEMRLSNTYSYKSDKSKKMESGFGSLEDSEVQVQLNGQTLVTADFSVRFQFGIEPVVSGKRPQKGDR